MDVLPRVQRHDIFALSSRFLLFTAENRSVSFIIQDVQIFMRVAKPPNFHPIFGRAGVGQGRHGIPDGAEMPRISLKTTPHNSALRLKHRSGGCGGICVAKMLDNTQSIICAFGLAAAAPPSPYRRLEIMRYCPMKDRSGTPMISGHAAFGLLWFCLRGLFRLLGSSPPRQSPQRSPPPHRPPKVPAHTPTPSRRL